MQLKPGDTFTDEAGPWEIVGRPVTERGGKDVTVKVQCPGSCSRPRHSKTGDAQAAEAELLLKRAMEHGFDSPTGRDRTYIIQVRDFIAR